MIAGYPDQGKSQILCSVAATITTGGQWPNGEGACEEKGAVMILAAEDAARDMLVPRLIAAGADLDQVIIVSPMVTVQEEGERKRRVLNIHADLEKLRGMLNTEANKGRKVKAILIDPLNAYYGGGKNFDVHKAGDMREMLTPLSKWCADKDVAVIAVGHFNKGNNSHLLYRITDSAAITAVCRAVWFAVKDEESDKFFLIQGKKNVAKATGGLEYTIAETATGHFDDDDGLEILAPRIEWGGPTTRTAADIMGAHKGGANNFGEAEAVEFITKALRYHGKLKRKTLEDNAVQYGIAKTTLRRAIERMNLKPIKSDSFPSFVSYSLTALKADTDELDQDDPLMTDEADQDQSEANFG
jgi:hypothetical protein